MSNSQNFIIHSKTELIDCFIKNDLKSNRTIKICMLLNIKYEEQELVDLFKEFEYSVRKFNGIIQIKRQLNEKPSPELKEVDQKITNFMPELKEKEHKISLEELNQQKIKFEKENFFMGYILFLNKNYIIFISTNRTEIIEKEFFNYFVKKTQGFSKLWLSYQLMDDFLTYLKKKGYEKTIEEISTFYSKYFRNRSEIRPKFNRDIQVKSLDSEETYQELKKKYGIFPKRYKIKFTEYGSLILNKKHSTIQFSNFDPEILLEVFIPWMFKRANKYISKILDFKVFEIIDPITEVKNNLSNYLIFNYNSKNELNLDEIIKDIRENPSYEIITLFHNNAKNIDIKANEKISSSIINMYLTINKVYFTLEEGVAYDAVYPILNLIDQWDDLAFSIEY